METESIVWPALIDSFQYRVIGLFFFNVMFAC